MNRHLLMRMVVGLGLTALVVIACGAFPPGPTSFPLPPLAATAPAKTPAPPAALQTTQPPPLSLAEVRHWLYLIDVDLEPGTVARMENSAYDLVVLDFITSEVSNTDYPLAEVIAQLHKAPPPKLVLGYIDIGQAENS